MTTFEPANLTSSKLNTAQYSLDVLVDGELGHRLSATPIDGIQRLTLKKDGKLIASRDSERGTALGWRDAYSWAKGLID